MTPTEKATKNKIKQLNYANLKIKKKTKKLLHSKQLAK